MLKTRILNLFSNCLLVDFDESTEQNAKSLWSPEYPYGTRTIGLLLDSVLHKAYKYLHGFSLANATSVDTKDIFANSTVSGCGKKNEFPPENVPAAAMLYRCIIRAYSAGRKSPPKAALDFVLDALPEVRETDKSKAIHHFLFSQTNFFQMKDLTAVIQQAANWEKNFSQVESILPAQIVQDEQMEPENESMIVRLGVSSLIAQGPLPHYQDSGDLNDSRSLCVLAEEELSKKFTAIIDDLRFSNVHNSEGWYKASQCLIMKAELIADRIGLSKGYTRSENFCIAEMRAPIMSSESKELAELEMKQEREAELRREGWVESLGNDMSLFIRYNWSSLNSLEALSAEVGEIQFNLLQLSKDDQTDDNDQMHRFHHLVWNEIDDLFAKNDIVGWQQAWGGIFVSSLRKVAYRCICISLAVAYKQDNETKNKLLISEIIESLGTMLYSDLMGSQAYGYPMHVVPTLLKREQFLTSLACFERAVEMTHELEKEKGDGRITWDLFFMMGKVSLRL